MIHWYCTDDDPQLVRMCRKCSWRTGISGPPSQVDRLGRNIGCNDGLWPVARTVIVWTKVGPWSIRSSPGLRLCQSYWSYWLDSFPENVFCTSRNRLVLRSKFTPAAFSPLELRSVLGYLTWELQLIFCRGVPPRGGPLISSFTESLPTRGCTGGRVLRPDGYWTGLPICWKIFRKDRRVPGSERNHLNCKR
jgi:hypothetical protein